MKTWKAGVLLLLGAVFAPVVASAGIPVSTIDFDLTVALDEGHGEVCGTQDSISVRPGDQVYLCYTVWNTGSSSYSIHDLVDSELGILLFDFPFFLEPGASLTLTRLVEITGDVTHTATWTVSGQTGSATDGDSLTVSIGRPALGLDLTVARSSGDPETDSGLCGTEDSITVPSGTSVVFCYMATNLGEVPFDRHDLEDDAAGVILSDFAFSLEPGSQIFLTQTVPIATDLVNTAVWSARNAVNPAVSAEATDAATVRAPEPGAATSLLASLLALGLCARHRRRPLQS